MHVHACSMQGAIVVCVCVCVCVCVLRAWCLHTRRLTPKQMLFISHDDFTNPEMSGAPNSTRAQLMATLTGT